MKEETKLEREKEGKKEKKKRKGGRKKGNKQRYEEDHCQELRCMRGVYALDDHHIVIRNSLKLLQVISS